MESPLRPLNQSLPGKLLKAFLLSTPLTSYRIYLIIVVITHLVMHVL